MDFDRQSHATSPSQQPKNLSMANVLVGHYLVPLLTGFEVESHNGFKEEWSHPRVEPALSVIHQKRF